MYSFGLALVKERTRQGLTQEELGSIAGVDNSQISCWEAERTAPSLRNFRNLCLALNMSADFLLGLKGKETTR